MRQTDEMTFRLAAVCASEFLQILSEAGFTALDLAETSFRLTTYLPLATNAIIAPRSAIHPEDGRYFVFVYENGNLLKRYVTLGVRFGDEVQILYGLEPGQKVMLP
jgi:hypothetical protein